MDFWAETTENKLFEAVASLLEGKDQLIDLAKSVMENVYPLKVPLEVNFGTGENWAQAH